MNASNDFDLVVIGTGMTGTVVAQRAAKAGWSVAVVDERPYGGTCALRGCDPKKVLVGAAEVADAVERHNDHGVRFDGHIDWSELMEFKRSFTAPVPERREKQFDKQGITTLHGTARFVGEKRLEIEGTTYESEHFAIASGAEPMELGIPGGEHLTTSAEFLEMERLPDRIAFVGGGYVSHEFAHVAARAGADVRILEMRQRPLEPFDEDLVDVLVDATEDIGVDYAFETRVERIVERDDDLLVEASRKGEEQPEEFEADVVVHGAGRVPRIEQLNLEAAGIDADRSGVAVDASLRSRSHPSVYAGGDAVAEGLPLTPIAVYHGIVIANNLLGGETKHVDHTGAPAAVFTLPPLASVGWTESEADENGVAYRTNYQHTDGWFTSRRLNVDHSAYKVLVEDDTERILGAHLVGPEAAEVINLFAVAIRGDLTATDLKGMLYAFPTAAHDIRFML